MSTKKPRKRLPDASFDLADDAVGFTETVDASQSFKVWLLDVGPEEYGDAVLCQFGNKTVLIDGAHPGDSEGRGGHPSIPDQIGQLLNQQPPYRLSLIIISHAHQDHIGCLPKLIKEDVLRADWALLVDPQLGWGRAADDDRDSAVPDRVRALAAALREEVRTDRTDDATLEQFLSDALTLEDRYNEMIETLRSRGSRVVRHGRDSGAALKAAFADVGLKIIGPSRNHMLECADVINGQSHDAIQMASDAFRQDATGDLVEVYRRIVAAAAAADALDVSRPGPGVNLQSIITRFEFRGHRFLFAGDMQFEKPQVNNDFLEKSVVRLRQKIADDAPYSLVKLSHHGSDNAFSEQMLQELGTTKLYGICAGEFSKHHPHAKVLSFLNDHRDDIKWARTDRNGLVTITFSTQGARVKLTTGEISDPQPNSSDTSIGGVPGGIEEPLVIGAEPPPAQQVTVASGSQFVEVHAKIPHVNTRVTITVDVEAGGGSTEGPASGPPLGTTTPSDAFRIAGGRQLPELLFVTNRSTLAANIGATECARVLTSIRASQQQLLDDLPPNLSSAQAAELVRRRLAQRPNVKGVVIVGGYDVVPAQPRNCLTEDLRRRLPANDDPDGFVVWSDDLYGVRGSSGRLELPVSRIPDGKSAQLVTAALQASRGQVAAARGGIRNVARPFADHVFRVLPGPGNLHVSRPATFNQQTPSIDLKSERVYFMLHGDYVDSSRFWGEGTANHTEAVNISNVPRQFKGVVFTGCCWGALTVDTPAGRATAGRPFGQKTVGSSLALSFLARGALAFIGCTGAHYSPLEAPYNYFGGPMHTAFWRHFNAGVAPALALLNAKSEYSLGIPHGRSGATSMAIENKILRQYTCLGLGW